MNMNSDRVETGAPKRKLVEASEPEGAPASKIAGLDCGFCRLPPEIQTIFVEALVSYADVKMLDILRFSSTCRTARTVALLYVTKVDEKVFAGTKLLTSFLELSHPLEEVKKVEYFWNFVRRTSPTIKELYLPQLCLHFSPALNEIKSINFKALTNLYVKMCRGGDWDILKLILDKSSVTTLGIEASKQFCDKCAKCRAGAKPHPSIDPDERCRIIGYEKDCSCGSDFFSSISCEAIESRVEYIHTLSLKNWNLEDGWTENIEGDITNLRALDIGSSKGYCGAQSVLEEFPNLQELRINCKAWGCERFSFRRNKDPVFENLKMLEITGKGFSDDREHEDDTRVPGIPSVTRIRFLNTKFPMSMKRWPSDTNGQLKSIFFENCAKLDNSYLLDDYEGLCDPVNRLIARNPGIEELSFIFSTIKCTVGEVVLSDLQKLTQLRYFVWIDGGENSDPGLSPEYLKNLQDIITPAIFPLLKFFVLYSPHKEADELANRIHANFGNGCTVLAASPKQRSLQEFIVEFRKKDPFDWSFPFVERPWYEDKAAAL